MEHKFDLSNLLKVYKALIWITLYAAALHFFDNVYFFFQYPEPAWLTREIVALLWIPIALMAHRAVDLIYTGKVEYAFAIIHSFVLANWISLGHYLFACPEDVLPRINIAIFIQTSIASVLFIMTLWLQITRYPQSVRYIKPTWLKNIAMYCILIIILESIFPSDFHDWWYTWLIPSDIH
ncbi:MULTISPECIES: hypothetical protein [Acinetobacter]|jgi:hypothetical protein|uniref:hypothetical protein n=1 Tax=Acinetobacter TaxID=469 RepID=UPI0002D05F65|nr:MULTISPECIES: hypothetical protein [Acinetobacter]APX61580.1 hypothetical protein AsACE_CH00123 [Acinetobacter schindleri]ENX03525.1 hypothetical protein F899_00429 [Acinetobacter sp. CIP 101934]